MLQVTRNNNQYYAKIRLFSVMPSGGKLKEYPQLRGGYGPSPFWPALLYGFSPDSTKLYDTSIVSTGSLYRERLINGKNGTLGADSQLISLNSNEEVAIGAVIAVQHQNASSPNQGYLDLFPNTPNPEWTIHCTMAMLAYCATATNIQRDRTGKFLFLTDPNRGAIHVASMKPSQRKIVDTGNSMPMTSQTPGFAFNQNGNIVSAMQTDGNVHFFHFDASTGGLTEGPRRYRSRRAVEFAPRIISRVHLPSLGVQEKPEARASSRWLLVLRHHAAHVPHVWHLELLVACRNFEEAGGLRSFLNVA